ncbi:MAG: DUF3604 domain-containing protein [Halioglobus sp.]
MIKILKILLGLVAVTTAVGIVASVLWFQQQREPFSEEALASDLAKQDESRVPLPEPTFTPQPLNRLFFGELHLHTEQSFDSVLFGNRLTIEDAYRFARGETITNAGGELMRLSEPLDFVAITDHAEGFGARRRCGQTGLSLRQRVACWMAATPNMATFMYLRSLGTKSGGKMSRESSPSCRELGLAACLQDAKADWADYQLLADRYNQPGEFTAFSAYEYSPPLADRGKFHRNILFTGSRLPELAYSAMDASTAIELWQKLDASCQQDCNFLTIPHNMNRAWGLPYARTDRYGKAYTAQDWELRARSEPLAEIYQIKGASECALGVGATDEECAFEQVFEPCSDGQETGCAFRSGFVREGLKEGLLLQQELGFNPMQFGFIGATDNHNSNPGDTEEWDYRGTAGALTSPAIRRQKHDTQRIHNSAIASRSSGGLAAVWASENTRESIFGALQRRESYATSGTRIRLRVLASRKIPPQRDQASLLPPDVQGSTPMGGVLPNGEQPPSFTIWAEADPRAASLQRIQMVKGWLEQGVTHEKVMDIACSDGMQPDPSNARCPDNGATVDLTNCRASPGSGARTLQTQWRDPDFNADQAAFYYVRVLENPSCRWSTYDALRLGIEPSEHAPATIQERAWSSPIWHTPN